MVALLTALAILAAAFGYPPVQSPGISISKANAADTETAAAEHAGRDAEEDSAGEDHRADLAAVDPAAIIFTLCLTACRRGRPLSQAAWPAAAGRHGPDSVRGPPA